MTPALVAANQVVARGAQIALPGGAGLTYPQLSVLLALGWLAALAGCRRTVHESRGGRCAGGRCLVRAAFIVLGALCMAAVVLPLDLDRPFVAVTFTAGLFLQLVSRWFVHRAAVGAMDDHVRTVDMQTHSGTDHTLGRG